MPHDPEFEQQVQRVITDAEETLARAQQQMLETGDVLAKARLDRWERHLRRDRRQGALWRDHIANGFVDMLKYAGLWTLVNFVFLLNTTAAPLAEKDVAAANAASDTFIYAVFGVFAVVWAVSVAVRWFIERRRIIARHRSILAHLHPRTALETPVAQEEAVVPVRLSRTVRALMEAILEAHPDDAPSGLNLHQRTGRSVASVYVALEQLEDAKWITGVWEDFDENGEPRRRRYQATEAGAAAYEQALAELLVAKAAKRFRSGR